jgi:D-glycero-D-manno-heptose 1,7-bisphosphate phosphatase
MRDSTSRLADRLAGRLPSAVFMDRDGTLIEDRHFLSDPDEIRLLPGAVESISRLNDAGIPVVIVTNQSGIGRGYYTQEDYSRVEKRLAEILESGGARVLATYHCPHAPDHRPTCSCRKPLPGLFERAAREHGLELSTSAFIGDRLRDLEPGTSAGGAGYLISGTEPEGVRLPPGVTLVDSVLEAVGRLLEGAK